MNKAKTTLYPPPKIHQSPQNAKCRDARKTKQEAAIRTKQRGPKAKPSRVVRLSLKKSQSNIGRFVPRRIVPYGLSSQFRLLFDFLFSS
jgi:hypothetical protein